MRSRYAVAAAIVALLALGASLAGISQLLPEPKAVAAKAKEVRPAYCADPVGEGIERAGSVAAIFVQSTVLSDGKRAEPECSFDLVTPELRRGETRASWKAGTIPVVPVVVDYLDKPGYVTSYAVDGSILPEFTGPTGKPCDVAGPECWPTAVEAIIVVEGVYRKEQVQAAFLIRLVERSGAWLVEYWQPLVDGSTPGPPQSD